VTDWQFPSTHKFEKDQFVAANESWPVRVYGQVVSLGQRTTKNKKGESVFDCNSYLVMDKSGCVYYFLEDELQ
jgi:hypothetical protein